MQDHVHLVVALSRTAALSDLIEEIKTSSSRWIKRKGESFSEFQWQRGYGAFSVSQSALQSVLDYLACQQEHHKVVSFQEEFRRFLEKHGIHFDGALPLHCEPPAQMDAAVRACIDECRGRRFMLSPTAGPYEATIGDCVRDNYIQFLSSAWKHGARPEYGMA